LLHFGVEFKALILTKNINYVKITISFHIKKEVKL